MKVYLGLDCGGSKTVALAADESGNILGRGVAGAANPLSVGTTRTVENIVSAIQNAVFDIKNPQFESIYIGMAGGKPAMLKAVKKKLLLTPLLKKTKKLTVDHDLRIALHSGIPDGKGIILIAGTGSAAWTVDTDGKEILVSGWNHWLGETGGYELGIKAIIASTRAYDGRGPQTVLLKRIMDAYQINDFEEISVIVKSPTVDSPKIASLAREVISAAKEGDAVAIRIIDEMIQEMDISIQAAATRAKIQHELKVVLVGGMFNVDYDIIPRLEKRVKKWNSLIQFVFPSQEPAQAALQFALKN